MMNDDDDDDDDDDGDSANLKRRLNKLLVVSLAK